MESSSLRFAETVRSLGQAARRRGLTMPAFRSPPRLAGVHRSLRRRPDGAAVVAVVVRDRPWPAVVADMVDGVIAANRLNGSAADEARASLWTAAGYEAVVAA